MKTLAVPHDCYVLEMLRNDEIFVIDYISAALAEIDEPGGKDGFLLAIRHLAKARGGMDCVSQATGLAKADLYRLFGAGGDPK